MNRLTVDLFDFTWPELATLMPHLHYAAQRLGHELAALRFRHPLAAPGMRARDPTLQQWAGLLQDRKCFAGLARAVEQVVDGQAGFLFLPDDGPPVLDLSDLLAGPGHGLATFLQQERRRARLAVKYVGNQPFDPATQADLLHTLDVEIRFFSAILNRLEQIEGPIPPTTSPPPASLRDQRVHLMFFSLPKALVSRRNPSCHS
jgi:hypothetical protein